VSVSECVGVSVCLRSFVSVIISASVTARVSVCVGVV
jgi:hypothetical protein